MGWFSDIIDTVTSPVTSVANAVGGLLGNVASNPIPAITSAVTGNPAALLSYAGGGGSNNSSSSSMVPNYFSSGGAGYSGQPIVINNTIPQATNNSGGMWASLIPALLQGTGGLLQQQTSKDAAQKAASTLLDAGKLAQQQAAFRPVGMTTSFGTSNFQVDPTTGQITQAGYSLSPQLQAAQEGILGGLRQNLTDAQTQAALGRSYLAQNPQQVASNWLSQQQALLAPSRDTAWARLNQGNYNQGTMGLKVAQGGNLQAANPYASALANAQAQQDAQLAAQAQQQGQQAVTFGQGLLSSAYQPVNTGLSTASALEQLGQSPLTLSAQLGQYGAQAGANAGKLGLTGSMGAAEAYLKPEYQLNPLSKVLSGIGQSSAAQGLFGQMFGGGNTSNASINPLGNIGSWDLSNLGSIFSNNTAMSSTPNYMDAAGQLPSLDYSNFVWG